MRKSLILLAVGLSAISATALSQGKFSGYMFGDYYYNVARDSSFNHTAPSAVASSSSAPGAKSMQAFQIRRIYFAYDNDISEQFATRFRLESDQGAVPGGAVTGDELVGGKVSVFVKDAYLTWKNVFSGSNLIFGVQPTAAYDISEAAWGYRFLEKTIMDLRGIVPSRDLGIALKGKLVSDGMVNYWVMIANGSGNNPESDKYKRYSANVQVKPITNLQATVYVDYKDAGQKLVSGSLASNSTTIEALFINYSEPFAYNFGFEAFMQSQSNQFTPTGATTPKTQSGLGYSLWGSYNIMPELSVVARYDSYDPNTDSDNKAKGDLRNYIIGGLSWKADKNVSISPNILYETYEAPASGTAPDASLTVRLTFYYVFL